MTIEEQLGDLYKSALKARQSDVVDCVRQVKAKLQETVNAKEFSGKIDDALYQQVISAYVKQLKKGIEELAVAGTKGEALCGKYQAEIDLLRRFLPRLMSEQETTDVIKKKLDEWGVKDPKQSGRIIGEIMKAYKGLVDPALVKQLVEKLLSK